MKIFTNMTTSEHAKEKLFYLSIKQCNSRSHQKSLNGP